MSTYNDIVSVVAYKEKSEIDFNHPFAVFMPVLRHTEETKDFVIHSGVKGYKLNIYDSIVSANSESGESMQRTDFKVTLDYTLDANIYNLLNVKIELNKLLDNNYALILEHLSGKSSIIRTLPHGWNVKVNQEGKDIKVTISCTNVSGIQRIHSIFS